MKHRNGTMKLRTLALAVQGALVAMVATPVCAEEEELAALKNPTNFVEIGAANVGKKSAKFGEYTGENKKGAELIGNFSLRGGDGYGDGNGVRRWSIKGSDLGLTSRSLGASVGDQGKWSLGVAYDELRHNTTTGYQTPYVGAMGGNSFMLPAGYLGTANTATTPPPAAMMQNVEVSNTRKTTSVTAGYHLSPQLKVTFDYSHLAQSGAKLMSFGTNPPTTTILGGVGGEKVAILPNPTNYTTDNISLTLDWVGDKGHLSGGYYGSHFKDGYDRVNFQNFFTGATAAINAMTTAPGNKFDQLNFAGGYAFSSTTKLAGGLSYGRNTQNSAFVDPFVLGTPGAAGGLMITAPLLASTNGLVVTSHADLKLTNQATKDLALSAGIKFDERDNRTPSNIYNFNAISGNVASHGANYPNAPYSNRKVQAEVAGDYRLTVGQRIRLAYNRENVRRWCNQYAVGGVNNLYIPGTNCVVAVASRDDRLSASYKYKASSGTDLSVGYVYSNRRTDSDPLARAAMISKLGTATVLLPTGDLVNGWGINAGDFVGFKPFFDASRRQHQITARVNWQATELLSMSMGGRITDDRYPDAIYGVQKGNSWSLNVDATYNYDENITFTPYLTQQHRQRTMTSLQSIAAAVATATAVSRPAWATWSNKLTDDDTTFGLAANRSGLLAGKLDLLGDLTYSTGATAYSTVHNYAGLTTGGLTCMAPTIASCGTLPPFRNTLTQLKLTGNYRLNKDDKVSLVYLFQKLASNDWFYNAYQTGVTPTSVMPTNQQSGSYAVNAVGVTYTHTFR